MAANFIKTWISQLTDNLRVRVMVFNATLNNIWQSVLLVEETGENHRPAASP